MTNMFSGKSAKQIPKTLSECARPDATASNLHHWSEKLENWGQILFVILITIGIITTIVETINMADINEDMVFMTCVTSAITWGLYAFIEYCAYHVLALLISALASITQNTIISANVALYKANLNKLSSDNLPQTSSSSVVSSVEKAKMPPSKPIKNYNKEENLYQEACWMEEHEVYGEALMIFQSLDNYKDSASRAAKIIDTFNNKQEKA